MLPPENRLHDKADFELVKEKGQVFQSESFGLAILKKDDQKISRFGFVISSKVSGLATQRNKAKRALREAMRQNLALVKTGYDGVFLAKETIIRKYTADVMNEVKDALRKADLYK